MPLARKLALVSKMPTSVIMALAAVTLVIGLARGEGASEMFISAVVLAVGAIPDGLSAAVTITLAIGGGPDGLAAVIRRLLGHRGVQAAGMPVRLAPVKDGRQRRRRRGGQCP